MTYNIPGNPAVKFDGETIAGIFLGKITKWNDSKLTALNSGVKLPDQDIVVVHRSDGSGTTFIFTDYLSKVSSEWKSKAGNNTSVNWPAGIGGKGNEGVSGQVKQTPGALGYVERVDDPRDARSKLIRLTPRGVDSLAQPAEIFDRLRARWVEQLGADRVRLIESSLRTVVPAEIFPVDVPGWFG